MNLGVGVTGMVRVSRAGINDNILTPQEREYFRDLAVKKADEDVVEGLVYSQLFRGIAERDPDEYRR